MSQSWWYRIEFHFTAIHTPNKLALEAHETVFANRANSLKAKYLLASSVLEQNQWKTNQASCYVSKEKKKNDVLIDNVTDGYLGDAFCVPETLTIICNTTTLSLLAIEQCYTLCVNVSVGLAQICYDQNSI